MKSKHFGATILALFAALLCVFVSSCKGETSSYYTITYETEHGTAPDAKKVLSGTVLTADDLPELTEDGFTFEGWYIGTSMITPELNYSVTTDVTLTAKWTQVTPSPAVEYFTISYQTDYGTAPQNKSVPSGYVLTAEDLPTLQADGYTFKGWYIGFLKIEAGDPVESDMALRANWTENLPVPQPENCTITYDANGVSCEVPASKTVPCRTELTYEDLPDLSDEDHEFNGWYFGSTRILPGYKVYTDMTLVAYWDDEKPAKVNYTVSYYSQFGVTPPSREFTAGDVLLGGDLISMLEDNYDFAGWYFGDIKMESGYPVMQDMVLVAKWIPYYTVSYITTFGTAPSTKRVPEGTNLTDTDLPDNYTEQGYTFDGWYLDTEKITAGYEVVSNITLMAKWLRNFTVSYSSERGSLPASKTVPDKTVLGSNDLQPLTADGYTFDGWYAGNTKITSSYQVTGDVTLIGKWNYTITYSTDHGTAPYNKTVVSGYALTQTDLQTLSDSDGYRFTGWKIGSQAAVVNYSVTDNITLTAQWLEIPSGLSLFVEADSEVTQDELNFAVTAEKSGDNYILTATPGYGVYLWSVDRINLYDEDYFYYNVDELDEDDLKYGNIPTEITSNTLTFNEDTLPSAVPKDGTYVVYVQAFKKKKISPSGMPDEYIYERVGIVFTVIRM